MVVCNNLQIIIGGAPNVNINDFCDIPDNIFIENNQPRHALECADVAILASGTATIEASIFNVPSVIIYKSSWLSWIIAKIFVKIPFVGMSNLIANKKVMPEFLQSNATPNKISNELIKIFNNKDYYNTIVNDLKLISEKLGSSGASLRAAKLILNAKNE